MPYAICHAETQPFIRVAIIQDTSSLRLKINGFYEIVDLGNNRVIYRGKGLNTTVTAYLGGMLLGNVKSKSRSVLIKSPDPSAISIDGRLFRGNIELIKKDNLHLLVINWIGLEDYVKGILYHEASHYWPKDALQAQAVICRTYALYQMQENSGKDYDVTSDVYSQVYGGKTSERYRTNKVVDETSGLALAYNGKIFPTYYHATCAGRTEDAERLWNIDIPPLKGVACPYCRESPHFNWHYVATIDEAKNKLIAAGYKIKDISSIWVTGRDPSRRITELEISSPGKIIKIPAKDFRQLIGPDVIRSTNFEVSVKESDIVFEGFGWGHGVGLCQWGAYFMAKKGYNYKQILKFYYPGSELTSSETIRF
ncbi:MAG: SpoIID/LytB domain-containing protein [Candidatus Omnitrophota bacterium]